MTRSLFFNCVILVFLLIVIQVNGSISQGELEIYTEDIFYRDYSFSVTGYAVEAYFYGEECQVGFGNLSLCGSIPQCFVFLNAVHYGDYGCNYDKLLQNLIPYNPSLLVLFVDSSNFVYYFRDFGESFPVIVAHVDPKINISLYMDSPFTITSNTNSWQLYYTSPSYRGFYYTMAALHTIGLLFCITLFLMSWATEGIKLYVRTCLVMFGILFEMIYSTYLYYVGTVRWYEQNQIVFTVLQWTAYFVGVCLYNILLLVWCKICFFFNHKIIYYKSCKALSFCICFLIFWVGVFWTVEKIVGYNYKMGDIATISQNYILGPLFFLQSIVYIFITSKVIKTMTSQHTSFSLCFTIKSALSMVFCVIAMLVLGVMLVARGFTQDQVGPDFAFQVIFETAVFLVVIAMTMALYTNQHNFKSVAFFSSSAHTESGGGLDKKSPEILELD